MSYTKTTGSENDIITAEKMNNIEEGVSIFGDIYTLEITSEDLSAAQEVGYITKTITKEDFQKIINSNFIYVINKSEDILTYTLYKNYEVNSSGVRNIVFEMLSEKVFNVAAINEGTRYGVNLNLNSSN